MSNRRTLPSYQKFPKFCDDYLTPVPNPYTETKPPPTSYPLRPVPRLISDVILRERGQAAVALDSFNSFLDCVVQDRVIKEFQFDNNSGSHTVTLSNIRAYDVPDDIRTCKYGDITYTLNLTVQATYQCTKEGKVLREFR